MCLFFFFNDTATTEIYPLSLHDALPICATTAASAARTRRAATRTRARCATTWRRSPCRSARRRASTSASRGRCSSASASRSEEHTSELQSRQYLVCRLLLEKKKKRE